MTAPIIVLIMAGQCFTIDGGLTAASPSNLDCSDD